MALTIGKLADAAGVHVETVRYYERRGLLDQPPRSAGGYRQYSADDLWRLQLIGRAKALGFTLGEIGDLLGSADRSPATIVASAQAKLAEVGQRQAELAALRERLERLTTLCQTGDPDDCVSLSVPAPEPDRDRAPGRAPAAGGCGPAPRPCG